MEYVIIDYKKTNRDRLLSMEQNNMDKQKQQILVKYYRHEISPKFNNVL